jgi:hypothetical protein
VEIILLDSVDKHIIQLGEEDGYLIMPDHRIPPGCSLDPFPTYLRVYQALFS